MIKESFDNTLFKKGSIAVIKGVKWEIIEVKFVSRIIVCYKEIHVIQFKCEEIDYIINNV